MPLIAGIDGRELQGRPTGTGRYLRSLLRHWTASGDDLFVVYLREAPPPDPVLRHPRVLVRVVPGRGPGLYWQETALTEAARQDALSVFFSPAYACPLRLRVPRVTAVHDLSFFSWPQDFPVRDALRRRLTVAASVRASAAVLACSDFTRRELAARFPDAAGRVRHVPLGPDDDLPAAPHRAAARARLGLRGPLVITVGAVLNRRRLPVLLQAWAGLARAWPTAVLEVVGENRTHPPLDLGARVLALGLAGRVRLAGFTSEAGLADRYAAADAAVFLSEYEGFGLPAVEAMARGVPVVASARPALSEVCGDAALLVEPDDPRGVGAALHRLLREPDLRTEMIRRGRARAAAFSWADTARLTRQALAEAAR